mgnify:CR=1 FL=1
MKKRKIRSTMSVFLTTFLLLQIILLFLYKSFIVDIAKKNDRDMTKQLDFFMDKFYPNVTGENRHLRLKNIAEVESLNMCEIVDKFISSQKA